MYIYRVAHAALLTRISGLCRRISLSAELFFHHLDKNGKRILWKIIFFFVWCRGFSPLNYLVALCECQILLNQEIFSKIAQHLKILCAFVLYKCSEGKIPTSAHNWFTCECAILKRDLIRLSSSLVVMFILQMSLNNEKSSNGTFSPPDETRANSQQVETRPLETLTKCNNTQKAGLVFSFVNSKCLHCGPNYWKSFFFFNVCA